MPEALEIPDELLDQIRETLLRDYEVPRIKVTRKTSLEELREDYNLDSLDVIFVVQDIEERNAVRIDDDELATAATVGDILDVVARLKASI